MKAVKRVRYGEKEARMLNKIVEGAKERRKEIEDEKAQTIEHNPQPLGDGADIKADEAKMEIGEGKPTLSGKTLKNEHGNYPVWMGKRQIAKIKSKKNKTTKHVEGKVVKQKGVVRKKRF